MFSLLLISAVLAVPCGPTAQARMDSAESLLSNLPQQELGEQLQTMEAAQSILDRTSADFPRCRAARRLAVEVNRMTIRIRPLAETAAHDQMVERLGLRISFMEKEASPDRKQVQHLARMVNAVASRHPEDNRIDELSYRLAMLGGTR
jgi:hypothetical protein